MKTRIAFEEHVSLPMQDPDAASKELTRGVEDLAFKGALVKGFAQRDVPDSAIVLAAMPAAVVTIILALEFDLDSSLVTSVVFVSTVLSPFMPALLIAYLS